MTIIDRLSQHTTIERDDTGTYMVTTSHEVAAGWPDGDEALIRGEWVTPNGEEWWRGEQWRIYIEALLEVYGYREGEPWCWYWVEFSSVRVEQADVDPVVYNTDWKLHVRAVLPCDGSADALETLHRWIEEPNHY